MSRLGAIGIAVVGAGGWGKNHVRNYAAIPDADLRYICDRHEGIRESMAVFDDTSADQKLAVFDKGVEPPATLSYEEGVRIRTGDILIPALKMAEPLRRECLAFLEAVRTRKAPVADGASGLHVVRALEGGSASLAEGGARIELPGGR